MSGKRATFIAAVLALSAFPCAALAQITTAGSLNRAQYDITRDGRFLVNTTLEGSTPPPISVILNWDALLKK
jgi:hypothetical protein